MLVTAKRVALLLILGSLTASPCFAHAKLQSSSPAANARLPQAPSVLNLQFDEAVNLARLVLAGAGREIPLAVDKTARPDRSVTVALPALEPGTYSVQWTAISADDGHITRGSFSFSLGSTTTAAP